MDIRLECARCGSPFILNTLHMGALGIHQIPKKCPACCDRAQKRPEEKRVIQRTLLEDWEGVEIHIPARFFREFTAQNGDRPCRRAILKGSIGEGAAWNGRIDIYDFRPDGLGLGTVRLMHVEHQAGDEREEKHGTMGKKVSVRQKYSPTYEYLAIDPDAGSFFTSAALVLASVGYKTTLKGRGRQYYANLDTSLALWAYEMHSSARSGRFGTHIAIAIVDDDHPVYASQTGDVKSETIWNLSAPEGANVEDFLPSEKGGVQV